jgi:predicted metal-binding membrane protein
MDTAVIGAVAAEGMEGMAMGGMSAAGWSFAGLAVFVVVWTVMMAAMMLPAAMPMILTFASAQARRERHVAVSTWTFVAGYLLVWGTAGLLVYVLVQVATELMTYVGSLDRGIWAPLALGATLVVAGMYQFTPLKRICLRHCRSPLGFVAQHWRDGRIGALEMGIRHGLYCLGCCWALFAVLIAAGIMSIAWMLLLTLIVFAEKVLPQGPRVSAVLGAAFICLGIIVTIDASWTPGHLM